VYVKSDTCAIGCVLCLTHVLAEPVDLNNFCRNSVFHFVLLSYICHCQECKFFTSVVMEMQQCCRATRVSVNSTERPDIT
jgi:hypothetical protein